MASQQLLLSLPRAVANPFGAAGGPPAAGTQLLAQSRLCCTRRPKEKGKLCTARHGTVLPSSSLLLSPSWNTKPSSPAALSQPAHREIPSRSASPSCPLPAVPILSVTTQPDRQWLALELQGSAAGWAARLERKPSV